MSRSHTNPNTGRFVSNHDTQHPVQASVLGSWHDLQSVLFTITETLARIEDQLAIPTARLDERLPATQTDLSGMTQQRLVKDYYSTEEVARIVGKDPYTVREWCRYGRLRGEKRKCGRGNSKEWAVSHAEVLRYQNEGLRPLRK